MRVCVCVGVRVHGNGGGAIVAAPRAPTITVPSLSHPQRVVVTCESKAKNKRKDERGALSGFWALPCAALCVLVKCGGAAL